ncbi:PSME3-interacting protein [Bombina bombina]|uniref:PSME3-interacting protein n=1 Tax=Bombina bombina TaxID=8345 RepID=UPI00235A5F7D|nr:PSME3-interacting protein [Bombina bombina]XP_053556220.1 PSME3-interacting protein [Bombina bombina]XP_053556221.1 PSME3-interacting protein [Bombina bombina]
MEGHEGDLMINKKFVTESEIEEIRKKRQEEWEKVRKPEDPEECPEEVYDPRSLYEKLQEQKDKKQLEYEEQFKFKNMVRGLDEDETKFLDEVSRKQELIEKQRRDEEMKELNEFRNARSKVASSSTDQKKREADKKPAGKPVETKTKFSQSKLLAGAVRHRSNSESSSAKKIKLEPEHEKFKESHSDPIGSSSVGGSLLHCPSASVCIGILPGLGAYSGSSDSESSSDSEATINSMGKIVSSVFRTGTYLNAP